MTVGITMAKYIYISLAMGITIIRVDNLITNKLHEKKYKHSTKLFIQISQIE